MPCLSGSSSWFDPEEAEFSPLWRQIEHLLSAEERLAYCVCVCMCVGGWLDGARLCCRGVAVIDLMSVYPSCCTAIA